MMALVSNPAAGGDRLAVALALREIAHRLSRERGEARFKAKAYERAARTLERTEEDLERLIAEDRLLELPGIGKALAAVIVELHQTGRSSRLERLREEGPLAATPRRDAPVLLARGLDEGERLAAFLEAGSGAQVEVAGDLRRAVETTDVVELVATTPSPTTMRERFAAYSLLRHHTTSADDRTLSGELADGTPVRVTVAAPPDRALTLLRRTGSTAHVRRLEERAAARGADWVHSSPADEADLYAALGLPLIAPELREDQGEIEAAQEGQLPQPLLMTRDVIGAVHCHTTASDGRHTLLQMAKAAEARGFQYMTVTDHSPSAHYARGLSVDRLKAQWDEIARVQEQVGLRLLRGTECDITREGALDWPDAILEQLQVVIASIHQRHKLDRAAMTARIVRGLRHPLFKIWGHALGRLIGRRPPVDCDPDAVLDALAESPVAVELNGDPHRLDMDPTFARRARQRGLRFVVSTDAHATAELDNVRYGVLMARRAWLTPEDVLNTRSADDFARAVRPTGG
jgi:DNA polymerase (family 10)